MVSKFNIRNVRWLKGFRDLPTPYYPLKCPGVTTIIGDLIPDPEWDKFVEEIGEEKAKAITEAAWHRGTAMHTFMEHFIKKLAETKDPTAALKHTQIVSVPLLNEENIPSDKIDKGRDMFFNFYYSDYSQAYIDLIGTEMIVHSPYLFFRGKADVFYNEKGVGRVVTDFKGTSSFIEKGTTKELKYKRQLGGYALAIEDMFREMKQDVKVSKSSILAVHSKKGAIQEIMCVGDDLEEQKEEFKTLVKNWHKINNQKFLFDAS